MKKFSRDRICNFLNRKAAAMLLVLVMVSSSSTKAILTRAHGARCGKDRDKYCRDNMGGTSGGYRKCYIAASNIRADQARSRCGPKDSQWRRRYNLRALLCCWGDPLHEQRCKNAKTPREKWVCEQYEKDKGY